MKKIKRALALVLMLVMCVSCFPAVASAATNVSVDPDKTPSDYTISVTATGPTQSHGSVTKKVGDEGFFLRCPTNTVSGSICRHPLGTFAPTKYCDIKATLSDSSIIGDITYEVGTWNDSTLSSECLKMNYVAKKAGTTNVTLTYYCNFMIDVYAGHCPTCGQYTEAQQIYTWYKYTDTFTVTVEADEEEEYTLTYDANGGENAPASVTQTSSEFKISDGEPTRDEHTFKGWADDENATVADYAAGDTLVLTASKTIYAVWEKNTTIDPTPAPDPDEKDSEPGMKKEVSEESVKPGDTVAFTLKSNVPDYLGDYLNPVDPDEPSAQADGDVVRGAYKLTLHDKMDSAFTFDPTSLVVKVNGKTINAESGLYTLTQNPDDDCTFHVTMDLVKIYEDGNYFTLEEIESCPEIVVTYNATLSEDAKAGTYKNTAWTGYEGKESEKPEVEVKVYGINVFKYDQSDNKGLAGAEFELKDSDGNLVATLTSGEDGYVTYEGLKAGTYTLTEITAPEGYVKSDKPLTITLPDDADETTLIAAVKFANSLVPHTGGNGTTMFTIIGLLIICAAAAVFVASRRKNGQKS